MPITEPDCTKRAIAYELDGSIGANRAYQFSRLETL